MSNGKKGIGKWPSVLHKLINDELGDEWNNVIERVKSSPHEASIIGAHHLMSPLQAACLRYPPYKAVEVLLDAAPDVVSLQNKEGETTLHLATEGSSEDVQILLLKSYPDAVMKQDKYGDTPFHRACAIGAMPEILEQFVTVRPDVVNVPNNEGITPFFMISQGYEMAKSLSDVNEEDGEYWDDWEKAMLLLKTAFFKSSKIPDGDTFYELIAAASTKCPMALLKTCIRFFPSQLLIQDKEGLTPLAIATRAEIFEEPRHVNNDGDDEIELDSRVQILLRAEPKAAMIPDKTGRYPLFHAIENNIPLEKGLKELLMASSQLLNTYDPITKLYPFMLAATKEASVDTIFQLFVAFPALSHLAIPESKQTNTKKNARSLDSKDVIKSKSKKMRKIL